MSKRKRNARNTAPGRNNDRLILGGGLIVVAALIAFVIFRSSRSTPVDSIPPAPAPAPAAAAPATDHDHAAESSVRRITAPEVRTALDRGEAVVVDVRDIDSYAAGHVAGAMHIPLEFIESQVPYLPRGKMLVTYCT